VVIDEVGKTRGSKRVAHSKSGLAELTGFLKTFTGDPTHGL
jgi:hypothetical protein